MSKFGRTTPQIRGGILRDIDERVRRSTKLFPGLDVRELFPGHVHRHERIKIEVSVDADRVGLLFNDGRLGLGRVYSKRR